MRRTLGLRPSALLVAVSLQASACGGGNANLPPPPASPPPLPASPTADAGMASAPAAPAVELVEGAPSPDPNSPTPIVRFVSPAKDQVIAGAKAGDFEVKLEVKNWKTAPDDAHIHVILDGSGSQAVYDPKAPVKLSDLAGGAALEEGQHVLAAFPSRANHESVKTPGALAVAEFWIGKKANRTQDLEKPLLVYSRPTGEYRGEMANHVLVDFELANDVLGAGKDHVHIAVSGPGIDGEKTTEALRFGPPFYLDNLETGAYVVKLELLGADGKALAGPWNAVSRTFSVAR